jgi:ISXO2-like transposase domain/Transposase zinc-ribbon domain
MARNPVQLQKGLSLTEFQAQYGTELQCREAVARWRWPHGFECPHCQGGDYLVTKNLDYSCRGCRKVTSLIAGTVYENTLLPLTKWFQGMYLLTQAKNTISGLELARLLGVRPDTASLMRHKLMSVMAEHDAETKLDGRIEVDDAVHGGVRSELDGGKRGRGGPNKTPFVVAVATNDQGHPLWLLLHVVKTHDGDAIEAMAKAHFAPTARIISDGLGCFRAVIRAGCKHDPVNVTKADKNSEKLECFRWVNTILSNIKNAIGSTLKSIAPRYVFRYFAEFQYRFNRRYDLPAMLDRIACVATRLAPRPFRTLQIKVAREAG